MSSQIINIKCLIEAVKRLGFRYQIIDRNGNFVRVKIGEKYLDFTNYSTTFNTESFAKIAKDKDFTYQLLSPIVNMPKTIGFSDPSYEKEEIISDFDLENITKNITESFSFPMVIKPNALSQGRKFSVCKNESDIKNSLKIIFNKNDLRYDYVALVQDYIEIDIEYRVVIFENEIIFVYDTRKNIIKDDVSLQMLKNFIKPIFGLVDVGFAGLDIIKTKDGRLYLLEMNSNPGFKLFIEKNGEDEIVSLYEKIFTKIINK
jgi:glutathione synthase/RimK-type ligase-like ATP-grasp enzyme